MHGCDINHVYVCFMHDTMLLTLLFVCIGMTHAYTMPMEWGKFTNYVSTCAACCHVMSHIQTDVLLSWYMIWYDISCFTSCDYVTLWQLLSWKWFHAMLVFTCTCFLSVPCPCPCPCRFPLSLPLVTRLFCCIAFVLCVTCICNRIMPCSLWCLMIGIFKTMK